MRMHRVYYPFTECLGNLVSITNDKAHYLRNVLRLKIKHKLRLFNHKNHEFLAEIESISKKHVDIRLCEEIQSISQSSLSITLVQGLSKGDRMDYTVQKATELGVTFIQPITSEFCEVKLEGKRLEKKIQHWKNIAISACEQCFRTDLPVIKNPISIQEYCLSQHKGIILQPESTKTLKSISQHQWRNFEILIGPEGGWSETDLKILSTTGLESVHFGQRILRTETMAPALLGAIHSLWGDFSD